MIFCPMRCSELDKIAFEQASCLSGPCCKSNARPTYLHSCPVVVHASMHSSKPLVPCACMIEQMRLRFPDWHYLSLSPPAPCAWFEPVN